MCDILVQRILQNFSVKALSTKDDAARNFALKTDVITLLETRWSYYLGAKTPDTDLPSSMALQIMCASTRESPRSSKNSCSLLGACGRSLSLVEKVCAKGALRVCTLTSPT